MSVQVQLTYLSTYIDGDGTLYQGGKIYEVDDSDGSYLLGLKDDRGASYFKKYSPPPPPTEEESDGVVRRQRGRPSKPKDTGAMQLNGVGVKGPAVKKGGVTIVSSTPVADDGEIDTGASSLPKEPDSGAPVATVDA